MAMTHRFRPERSRPLAEGHRIEGATRQVPSYAPSSQADKAWAPPAR